MKSGDVAKILGIDRKTVNTWAERFQKLLSSGALPGTQRDYNHDDITVLFSVLTMRAGNTGWEEIAERLGNGERYMLPDQLALAPLKGQGKTGSGVVASAELMIAAARISDLEVLVEDLRKEMKGRDAENERKLNEKEELIYKLQREIGALEAKLAMARGQE